MIVLFTDFGLNGPYIGQVEAAIAAEAPAARVINLFANAPPHNPKAAAYLLAAYTADFPEATTFLCVVDPGVGGARAPGVLDAEGRRFVGPDNGLFELIIRRAREPARWRDILWRPERLAPSFHGRDLFAPIAARLETAMPFEARERPVAEVRRLDWPDDLAEIIYIDDFGNAVTGLRAVAFPAEAGLAVAGKELKRVTTFSDVSPGDGFCYENANGLLEVSVNKASAERVFSLAIGSGVDVTNV